ncbi:MAG: PAS domain S-box protein [Xanthomonadales bacterium]|nr:PAS domain S-box protein [Xanthomonadales bacterium]
MIEALRRSQVDGELFKQQFRVASSGGYRWMESIGGIECVNGKPIRLLGFTNDVTERKNIGLEKDRLYLELDQPIAALDKYAITAALDLEGVIQATNGLFCEFCGLEEAELIGQKFASLLMEDLTERPGGDIR